MNKTDFFLGVAEAISSSLDIGAAMNRTYEFLRPIMSIDAIALFYYDFDLNRLQCLAEVNQDGIEVNFEQPRDCGSLPPGFRDSNGAALDYCDMKLPEVDVITDQEKRWHLANNQCMADRYSQFINGSVLRVWLQIGEDMPGTFSVFSKRKNVFTKQFLKWFAHAKAPLAVAMSNARRYQELLILKSRLEADNQELHRDILREKGVKPVGINFGLRDVMEKSRQVASTQSPVLILGETGTGKEVIANTIHQLSNRRSKPMIKVQCGAIPDTLLDSELFGHDKGAFTGAISKHRGRFERADGGTLFLDEIGELSMSSQVKLLRVLQEKVIERLGGDRSIPVDVRIIAATNRNLEQMVYQGKFREDLWFRLNVFPIHIPPLRYRTEDIPSLISHIIERKRQELSIPQRPLLRQSTIKRLQAYDWPGNVRELQNVIERALIINPGPFLDIPESLLTHHKESAGAIYLSTPLTIDSEEFSTLDAVQKNHIELVMKHCRGKVNGPGGAASILGVNPNTLRARMKKLGIAYGRSSL